MTTTAVRVPLCTLDELPLGLGRAFEIRGRALAVFRARDDRVFVVDGTCPHKGGPLADGMLIGEQVVCPLHAFRFHGTSGACDQPGTCGIDTFAAEVDGDEVFVLVPTE